MTQRRTYDERKIGKFKLMYMARQNIVRDKREWIDRYEDVNFTYMDPYYEGMDDLDRLMFETIYLILTTNAPPIPGYNQPREVISEILTRIPLEKLLEDIPESEARDLRIDLEYLGLIPPDITKPQYG
jgi:hypothetical protein